MKKNKDTIKKAKTKTQINANIKAQESVTKNALDLYDKRTTMINAFINRNIRPKNVYQSEEPEFEQRIAE